MRALAILALLAALPAAGQWKLPDKLPPLPDGGATCNDAGTHCLVNRGDWLGLELLAQIAGVELAAKDAELARKQAEIDELLRRLAAMRPRCAIVEKIPTPGGREL